MQENSSFEVVKWTFFCVFASIGSTVMFNKIFFPKKHAYVFSYKGKVMKTQFEYFENNK